MAYASVEYTTNGTVGPYSFSFPYIDRQHIEVYVAGVLKTLGVHYTFPTTSTIQFTSVQATGQNLRIRRNTTKSARLVNFQDASVLAEAELDRDSDQMFYLAQEAVDRADTGFFYGTDGTYDATNRRIRNLGDAVAPSDAVTKNYADTLIVTGQANVIESAANLALTVSARDAAATSASGALTSRFGAETSELNAGASEANAAASAAAAAGSASTASAAATTATTAVATIGSSVSAAAASATSAGTSATAAAGSASAAAASATAASGAGASATAAAGSATAAAGSATSAATSATNAAASAATAATYASPVKVASYDNKVFGMWGAGESLSIENPTAPTRLWLEPPTPSTNMNGLRALGGGQWPGIIAIGGNTNGGVYGPWGVYAVAGTSTSGGLIAYSADNSKFAALGYADAYAGYFGGPVACTSTIDATAYLKSGLLTEWDSGEYACPANFTKHDWQFPIGGGRVPKDIKMIFRCITAELGYAVGDFSIHTYSNATAYHQQRVVEAAGLRLITYRSTLGNFWLGRKDTGTPQQITAANWMIRMVVTW